MSLPYEKTLKHSTLDRNLDGKKAEDFKNNYNLCLDKRGEIMKSTQFKVGDVFGDISNKEIITGEQMTISKILLPK